MSRPAVVASRTGIEAIRRYYRWQGPIYDLTRWSFLFGRGELVERLAWRPPPERVLEVGCGTGRNLVALRRQFPRATLVGIDASADMLGRARARLEAVKGGGVQLELGCYGHGVRLGGAFDLVLFSYSLSMMNPGWELAIETAARDLAPGGRVAAVDFHETKHSWFRRWMRANHVELGGHLLGCLNRTYETECSEVRPAYGGLWKYCLYVGTAL